MLSLDPGERSRLRVQRVVGWVLSPLWATAVAALLGLGLGFRIDGLAAARARYREIRDAGGGPLLVCANHLTLIDSALVAWALGSPAFYVRHFSALPWNVPERRNFAASWWSRVLIYVLKCVPITRGGDRREVASVLARMAYLLQRGDAVLLFPEAGRSRTGRVDVDSAAWGVGRLVASVPGCRVLCVYLRGHGQRAFSDLPQRGERFHVELSLLEPKSDLGGLRRSMDLSRQIASRLAEMERGFLDGGA